MLWKAETTGHVCPLLMIGSSSNPKWFHQSLCELIPTEVILQLVKSEFLSH